MLESIKIDVEVLEMMIFYWESVGARDKMSDEYFTEIANKKQMQIIYNEYKEEFSAESFRRVLSAISNRERLNNRTQAESKFWNQNMRMLEDLSIMRAMVIPIKKLNLDELKQKGGQQAKEIEVIFIPCPDKEYYIDGNKIYINFFKIYTDCEDKEKVSLAGRPFKEFIEDLIKQF